MSAATGAVRALLRLEGLAVLALSLTVYWVLEASWLWFALLFLAPDLSFAGYLRGPRVGALAYNLAHTYVVPLALMGAAVALELGRPATLLLVWTAHIGFDRMLGLGLKYPTAFRDTHLSGRRGLAP
ncbi:MAG TPA: DUF4260 domain-containing protein [Gemmatimonadales bacterium]|nr:DUF4260 domain-containing protein [Gemmatimonadales bacterium]